jgi:hypothetical protein
MTNKERLVAMGLIFVYLMALLIPTASARGEDCEKCGGCDGWLGCTGCRDCTLDSCNTCNACQAKLPAVGFLEILTIVLGAVMLMAIVGFRHVRRRNK